MWFILNIIQKFLNVTYSVTRLNFLPLISHPYLILIRRYWSRTALVRSADCVPGKMHCWLLGQHLFIRLHNVRKLNWWRHCLALLYVTKFSTKRNFTSHRAFQQRHQSNTAKSAKTFLTCSASDYKKTSGLRWAGCSKASQLTSWKLKLNK